MTQGHAGIKTDAWLAGHQRIVDETFVLQGIVDDKGPVAENGVTAEGNITWRFASIQPDRGFEPLPVFVDQADQRDRHVEDAFGQACQAVEALFRIGVEDVDRAQRSQALRLI